MTEVRGGGVDRRYRVVDRRLPIRDALRRDESALEVAFSLVVAPLALVDLPFTGLLDTVLLPLDYVAHRRYAKAAEDHRIRVQELFRREREGGRIEP